MKVALSGILHNKSIIFYNDYIRSIYNQTYTDFDIVLFSHKVNDVRSIYLSPKLSLTEAKKFSIDYIKNLDYDIILFSDTDDFLHEDYVKEMVVALKDYNMAFADFNLYRDNKIVVENYFEKCGVPDEIDSKYIEDKNCMGFGNSGIRLDIYSNIIEFPKEFNNCDWWFFRTLMEKNNCKAKFIKKGLVYYRQHEGNINYLRPMEYKLWNQK